MELFEDPANWSHVLDLINKVDPPTAESLFCHGRLLELSAGPGRMHAAYIKRQAVFKYQGAMRLGHFRSTVCYSMMEQFFHEPGSKEWRRLEELFWSLVPEMLQRARGDDTWMQRQVNNMLVDYKDRLPPDLKPFRLEPAYATSRIPSYLLPYKEMTAKRDHLGLAKYHMALIKQRHFESIVPLVDLFRGPLRMPVAARLLCEEAVKIGSTACMARLAVMVRSTDPARYYELLRQLAFLGEKSARTILVRSDPDVEMRAHFAALLKSQ